MASKHPELERLREKIDEADKRLIEALSERMQLVEKIGELKRKEALEVVDERRWSELLAKRLTWAGNRGLSSALVKDIFELIHKAAVAIEKK